MSSAVVLAGLTACGGGDSGGAGSDSSGSTYNIVSSGTTKGWLYLGSSGVGYLGINCLSPSFGATLSFEVSDNGFAYAEYYTPIHGYYYSATCLISSAVQRVSAVDGSVNGIYSLRRTSTDPLYVDASTNTHYSVSQSDLIAHNSSSYYGGSYKMTGVTNQGLSAILDDGQGDIFQAGISDTMQSIPLSSTPVNKYSPAPLYQGSPNEIFEVGKNQRGGIYYPYSIHGNFYNYKTTGCTSEVGANYTIYNDGFVATEYQSYNNVIKGACQVTDIYERLPRANASGLNGTMVNSYLFVDNGTQIYYDVAFFTTGTGLTFALTDIINDGATAILTAGDGTTTKIDVLDIYKKI
jgi:hypothetical protein